MEVDTLYKLEEKYMDSEISVALKGINPLKAPRPNIFQAIFYHKAWDVVGLSVTSYIK